LASVAPAALRGKAVGGMTSALFLGQFFSPIIIEPFINRVGLSATFVVAGIAALLMAILFAASATREKRTTSR
jgi:MFS family permease